MGGRIEKETRAHTQMKKKLEDLPEIISKFYHWMDAREKSYTTMKNYINHVIEFMEFVTNGKRDDKFYLHVTDDDIERYMTHVRRKDVDGVHEEVGDGTRASKWSSLNTFFKFLSQKKHISNNPMLLTERPRVRTQNNVIYMTEKEIESVFAKISTTAKQRDKNRDACLVALGLGTALRVSAIVNIDIEDIDFRTQTIKVIEKGRKTRELKFGENLKNLILIWMKDRELYFGGQDTGPLFVSQLKTRMSVDTAERLVKKYTQHLPKHITPHKLRSSAAMQLHGAGIDILTIASILGHENVATTQRYTRAYDEDRLNASNILDSKLI